MVIERFDHLHRPGTAQGADHHAESENVGWLGAPPAQHARPEPGGVLARRGHVGDEGPHIHLRGRRRLATVLALAPGRQQRRARSIGSKSGRWVRPVGQEHSILRARQHPPQRRLGFLQRRRSEKLDPIQRHRVQATQQLGRSHIVAQLHIQDLAQRRHAQSQRRPEAEAGLGMEATGIGDVESSAPEDAWQVAHQIEMSQVRGRTQFGVAQAIATGLGLGKTGQRPGRSPMSAGRGPRRRCGTLALGPGVHASQEEEPLPLHLVQIAGHAAVVADQLLVRGCHGLGHSRRMQQALH